MVCSRIESASINIHFNLLALVGHRMRLRESGHAQHPLTRTQIEEHAVAVYPLRTATICFGHCPGEVFPRCYLLHRLLYAQAGIIH